MAYTSITVSGPIASGTSTTAKMLAEKLNLEYHSAGDFFRKYMAEHNIPLPNKEEVPDDIERKVDQELTNLMASQKPVVIDGLYASYFAREMPHVLRVLLTAAENVRIVRAVTRQHTHEETDDDVRKRDKAHDLKFRKLYADENFLDPKFFNIVIDTTNTNPEEVVDQISKKFTGE